MTITLPIPHADLWPNSRKHWRVKAQKVKHYRMHAKIKTVDAFGGVKPSRPFSGYHLAFYYPDARKRDDDNASAAMKSARDGIADALGVDDNTLRLAALPTFQIDRGNPRVEITLI